LRLLATLVERVALLSRTRMRASKSFGATSTKVAASTRPYVLAAVSSSGVIEECLGDVRRLRQMGMKEEVRAAICDTHAAYILFAFVSSVLDQFY
jgi:hypothetical protein